MREGIQVQFKNRNEGIWPATASHPLTRMSRHFRPLTGGGEKKKKKNRNEEKKKKIERISVINKANKKTDLYLYFFKCCSSL